MINWAIMQVAGFWWTSIAILAVCTWFDIPIHINLVP